MSDANKQKQIFFQLQKVAKRLSLSVDYVLRRYAAERLLYRVGESSVKDDMVLKGGALFLIWIGDLAVARPTMDTDFHFSHELTVEKLSEIISELCALRYEDDGLEFDVSTVRIRDIRAQNVYGGFEVSLTARLGKTRIPVHIDIGIGDSVTPDPKPENFPQIISGMLCARLLTYPKETVVAEKVEAMVSIGLINSRMKDFYDVWYVLTHESFNSVELKSAFIQTFRRRKTDLPSQQNVPVCFLSEFYESQQKHTMWKAFLSVNRLTAPSFQEVVLFIKKAVFQILQG